MPGSHHPLSLVSVLTGAGVRSQVQRIVYGKQASYPSQLEACSLAGFQRRHLKWYKNFALVSSHDPVVTVLRKFCLVMERVLADDENKGYW